VLVGVPWVLKQKKSLKNLAKIVVNFATHFAHVNTALYLFSAELLLLLLLLLLWSQGFEMIT
jgi:hypothetical protein